MFDEIVFYPYLYGKTFIFTNNKFFSIYNYLFRFFCLFGFQWTLINNLSLNCLVGPSGLEPPTSCLSGTRSNLLSYEPMWLVRSDWISLELWWRWWDSNPWPPACRAGALPAELHPHIIMGFAFSVFLQFRGKILLFPRLKMSALSYLPVQSPVKYFHHCRA